MSDKIVSACRGCENEFGDKNKCALKCDRRMGPVMKIGAMVASMEPVVKKRDEDLMDTLNDLEASFKSVKKETKNVEELINSICLGHGIEREMLHSKDASIKVLKPLRVKLAQTLSAAGVKHKEIADIIGCPLGSVSNYLYVKDKPNERKGHFMEQDAAKNEHTSFGDEPYWRICANYDFCNTCREQPEDSEKINPNDESKLTIDFKDHLDLYNDLVELSKERLRTPAKQVLWILLNIREKGMKTITE